MAKYDGLIIPRSYNDYINKSSPIDVLQALQLSGVMDNAPAAESTKPAKSGGIFAANAVIMASSATLTGVAISAGSVVRVLFTADLTGSNTTTGLILTYNGNAYAVKVGKNGALAAFVASEISSGVFKYLQAYTTLELMFDGTQFIIIGNPVVLSSTDYTIYADGAITYKNNQRFASWHFLSQNKLSKNSICDSLGLNKVSGSVLLQAQSKDVGDSIYQLFILYWHNTTQVALTTISYKDTALVTVDNTDLTGIASGYYIDLSVIGYNDKY